MNATILSLSSAKTRRMFLHLVGIESPGLVRGTGHAKHVREQYLSTHATVNEKSDFKPERTPPYALKGT
jgi:hypothetical protein